MDWDLFTDAVSILFDSILFIILYYTILYYIPRPQLLKKSP